MPHLPPLTAHHWSAPCQWTSSVAAVVNLSLDQSSMDIIGLIPIFALTIIIFFFSQTPFPTQPLVLIWADLPGPLMATLFDA